MYAITGITGKVGGELARTLLAARQPVRGIVRDAKKGEEWAALGCELAVAEMEDASALAGAFGGATAVFILPPSELDPEPGYPEARAVIDSVVEALKVAKPKKVLCLSTIGADAERGRRRMESEWAENPSSRRIQIAEVRERKAGGESVRQLARSYRVSPNTISRVR
jgi:uncharacterized protein YbjT (DUF2867 family)